MEPQALVGYTGCSFLRAYRTPRIRYTHAHAAYDHSPEVTTVLPAFMQCEDVSRDASALQPAAAILVLDAAELEASTMNT